MTCPATFHLCPSSADRAGFSVLDCKTGKETVDSSEVTRHAAPFAVNVGVDVEGGEIVDRRPDHVLEKLPTLADATDRRAVRKREGMLGFGSHVDP